MFLPRGHCGQPWLAISDDEGMSWRTTQVSLMRSRLTPQGAVYEALATFPLRLPPHSS